MARKTLSVEWETRKAEAAFRRDEKALTVPKRAILLFTRIPEPGKTKTRMMPYLSPEECAALHESFLKDIIGEAAAASADLRVYHTPEELPPSFVSLFPKGTAFFPQVGEHLGERMERALTETLEGGYSSAVLVGTDLPELRREDFHTAFRILEQRDVVLGPTRDGGYWLIGMNRPHHAPFLQEEYGHDSVFENTMAGITAAGLRVGRVRELSDMDTKEDLAAFRDRMRAYPALWDTHSGRFVFSHTKISVIVPTYNEEKALPTLLKQLERFRVPGASFRPPLEFLFTDGGSTDRTLSLLEEGGWPVITGAKGRANQMNLAAEQASGDVLLFLHADSEVPKTFPEDLLNVLKTREVGCFGIAYRSRDKAMKINSLYANHFRLPLQKIMFGDQGIFLTKELFERAGGYPPIPIMEDLQFSLTLRDMGKTPGLAKTRIYTSSRRHPEKSFVKQMLSLHQYPQLRKLYREGVSIDTISEIYKDIR